MATADVIVPIMDQQTTVSFAIILVKNVMLERSADALHAKTMRR